MSVNPCDLVVVYSPVGGGHKAAALATAEAARARGLSVEVLNAFEYAPRWAGDAYLAAHLTGQNAAPELYGKMYESANRRGDVFEPIRLEIDNLVFGGLTKRVCELNPRAVIATHHLPLVVLARARREGSLVAPLIGVVTDYTTHACWAETGVDLWAVPCEEARRELEAHGAPRSRIVTTGIPVRAAFEEIAPMRISSTEPTRRANENRALRVLVTSGGFGAAPMTRIVRSFADVTHVELTVVCGAAPKLVSRIKKIADACGVNARVIGFERDMPARMAEAHVVVGKAGGLTVTETLTAGRPMVIASAVPGNEKVNEERVVRAGAGVAAKPNEVGAIIERLRAANMLESMGERARSLVTHGAAMRVVDHALAMSAYRAAA